MRSSAVLIRSCGLTSEKPDPMEKNAVGATAGVGVSDAIGVAVGEAVRVGVAVNGTHTSTTWLGSGVSTMVPPWQVTTAWSPAFSVTVIDAAYATPANRHTPTKMEMIFFITFRQAASRPVIDDKDDKSVERSFAQEP